MVLSLADSLVETNSFATLKKDTSPSGWRKGDPTTIHQSGRLDWHGPTRDGNRRSVVGITNERTEKMAILDWSQCPAVESVPDRLGGAWVFRDTRMPVSAVFENLEAGASIDDIIEQFDITREQINTVLEFAARSLDAPPLAPGSSPVDAHSV
jgi:uncharacterized protein (DUF433 family)